MEKHEEIGHSLNFTYIHAAFIIGAVFTYLVDQVLDLILATTYIYDGHYAYAAIILVIVLLPSLIVQIFSVRWHQIDGVMTRPKWTIHVLLMGVLHRYLDVLNLGLEAMKTGHFEDMQRFYQRESDVCMLRLFDSFGESAPQIVFHLYVMIIQYVSAWPLEQALWTGMSATASVMSLGYGIAAYSWSMRMIRSDRSKLTWSGLVVQTLWRAFMLLARIVALVMLTLALDHWSLVVMFVHWLVMTSWVIWQDTDFCKNPWEERLYNAVVGVIYCFAFFNIKDGKSRYRASIFYAVVILENLAFVAVFYWLEPLAQYDSNFSSWFVTSAFVIVVASMVIGLSSMLIYYRFFHPAGPIRLCVGASVDFQKDLEELQRQEQKQNHSPDFQVISEENASSPAPSKTNTMRRTVSYSRSFKTTQPQFRRSRESTHKAAFSPEEELAGQMSAISPISTRNYRERAIDCGPVITLENRVDSAYGTDSNHGSPVAKELSDSSGSSNAFNNDTYMISNDKSDDNTYMSVNIANVDQEKMLKRSPVVRDVTSGFATISSTKNLIRRKMTILVPSLEKTISLEALNPTNLTNVSNHDYENMALININRQVMSDQGSSKPVAPTHWRTYSNMADGKHDESSAYEKQKYYDIYPLSKELKEQLYRSLTPLSTAATMASESVASNDTYEPIENYDYGAVTLIHHDGDKLSTQRITNMECLKEVLHKHDHKMDDPQDRPDLYILAPMRILSPIMEESEQAQQNNYTDLNKSLMTVISEILSHKTNLNGTNHTYANNTNVNPDGHFADSIESSSSLVHTIDVIRNNSLCNLYYTTGNELNKDNKPVMTKSTCKAAPQVPKRNEKPSIIHEEEDPPEPESPDTLAIQERRKKSPLYTSVGSRKNLLELAGTTNHILNTPQKVSQEPSTLSILDPSKLQSMPKPVITQKRKDFDPSILNLQSHSLSPSAKYETPTPPLKTNQFTRNTNAYRPRRKFSMIREKFEDQVQAPVVKPKPMILKAKSKTDLYENVSDDFLTLRSNSIRAKAERMAKCQSVPGLLQPDEQYNNGDNFMPKRNQWSTASYQKPVGIRNSNARRSMSILDDKENCPTFPSHPFLAPKPCLKPPAPPLRPKLKSVNNGYRLSSGASLSPQSKIFTMHRT